MLATLNFVNAVGLGVYLTLSELFLTRTVGLSSAAVGLGLSLAGVAGLAGGILLGDLADGLGARRVLVVALGVEAAAMTAFALAGSFTVFVLAAVVGGVAEAGRRTCLAAVVALCVDDPVAMRAYLRAMTNVGAAVGAGLAGMALALRSDTALVAVLLANASSFGAASYLATQLPASASTRRPATGGMRWAALHNRPYLAITALDGILALHRRVLTFGIPLWIAQRTDAPHWIVAPLLLINSAVVVIFQVAVARGVDTPRRAAAAMRRTGFALAVGWLLIALAAGLPSAVAIVLLVIGVLVHTSGEIVHAAGSFELSYSLADASTHGQHQGVFGVGRGVAEILGPLLVSALCLSWGRPGWLVLGALVITAGLLAPCVVDRARTDAMIDGAP